jgi:enoyl-CoA hydratase
MERKTLKNVIYEKDPPIGRIILNRPEKANSQTDELAFEVDDCFTQFEKDWDLKVLILKGNGRGFCAGHAGGYTHPQGKPNNWRPIGEMFLWPSLHIWECAKPTIAQVHGYCIGGGLHFALFTDLTICSEDAYFQMPLPQGLGLVPGSVQPETWLFMNWKRTYEFYFTAQTLTAQEALQMGFVNKVVPREKLEETVEEMARVIAMAPISTLMMTKASVKRAYEGMGLRTHQQTVHDLHLTASQAADVRAMGEERSKAIGAGTRNVRTWAAQQRAKATGQTS